MFCCAPPSVRKFFWLHHDHEGYQKLGDQTQLCIVYDYDLFRKSKTYLPKLREHKIQEEPNFVIDDPSSIFFDPDEKAGFVYGSHGDSDDDLELEETNEAERIDAIIQQSGNISHDTSLELDDSLDHIPQTSTSSAMKDASFDQEYGVQSRRESSEPELAYSCDEADYHRYGNNTPVNLMLSSDKSNLNTELGSMRLYEDSGYGSGGQRQRKDYNSDAESTNKYQDSGIYEDDVFLDSPKHNSGNKTESESFIHDVEFEMDDFLPEHSERNTAFKTPSSSPLKLEPTVPLSRINGRQQKPKGRLSRFLQQEREDVPILSGCDGYYNCDKGRDTNQSTFFNDRTTKPVVRRSSGKYSHVQAKVQTRRTSSISPRRPSSPSGRSSSQGKRTTTSSTNGRSKSTEPSYKPMYFGRPKIENIKTEFRKTAKPKVGSMENVGHTPGGGQSKVFQQKLSFRKNAESKTDTHGVEMYSHLPKEFQEIARRLSRQDHHLKANGKQGPRGRTSSRSSSAVGSSRTSSVSPTRGRSKVRNRPPTPSLPLQKTTLRPTSPSRQTTLSRSPSIRSIPTTPVLHYKHPATSSILYDKKCRSRNGSPCSSRAQSPTNLRSNCSSRASSPTGTRSRSKSRSRPGTPKNGESQPTTPIRQLYQFTQANTFIPGSPKSAGPQPVFHFVPVR
ncbi:serine/arginine repetitive matrix protein 2-like isoform X1 [Rhopilema esculentum]|uniref:serine/arginine repetitive matrix protein 2-like isoform X1 n=1 Tax=Rhopilema esculentum TaxID=499914 RepID=UPI0031DE4BD4